MESFSSSIATVLIRTFRIVEMWTTFVSTDVLAMVCTQSFSQWVCDPCHICTCNEQAVSVWTWKHWEMYIVLVVCHLKTIHRSNNAKKIPMNNNHCTILLMTGYTRGCTSHKKKQRKQESDSTKYYDKKYMLKWIHFANSHQQKGNKGNKRLWALLVLNKQSQPYEAGNEG
jgi:hypothetical protein